MSELSHQAAFRLIYERRPSEPERLALEQHLRHCAACRQDAHMAGLFSDHLLPKTLPARPSPQFTAAFRQKAARRCRRSRILATAHALGALAALALLVLAGWFTTQALIVTRPVAGTPMAIVQPEVGVAPQVEKLEPAAQIADEDLMAAVLAGDAAEVARLLAAGAGADAQDENGNAALARAARDGQLAIVQLLLDAGADANGTATLGLGRDAPAIALAATYNHLPIVELLIAHGADVNQAETTENTTAVMAAARFNHYEVVKLLLDNGADPNWKSAWNEGETALHWAAVSGAVDAAAALLDAGAQVDIRTGAGKTPLMTVICNGEPNAGSASVPFLLDHGADPNMPDRFGNTALHHAADANQGFIVPLLERGAQIDLQNNLGETALHLAAQSYTVSGVKILIENGASLDIKDHAGRTALDVAAKERIAQVLRQAGATGGSGP